MKLRDEVVLVTGAGGIGRAVCLALAEEGAGIVVADLVEDRAREVAELVGKEGGTAVAMAIDVTSSEDVDRVILEVLENLGSIDVLVNTAGIFKAGDVSDFPDDLWQKTIDVNLTGTMYCTRAVTRIWLDRNMAGRVINFGSLSSFVAVEGSAAYCASKAAVLLYTRVAGLELAKHGIRVNCVAPGPVDSPMLDQSVRTSAEREQEWLAKMPIHRFIQPREVAEVVAFLASDDSSALVGECIVCDGGYIIH